MEPARCPSCDAVVASGADWCSLCFADLRPAEARQSPDSAAAPVTAAASATAAAPAAEMPAVGSASWQFPAAAATPATLGTAAGPSPASAATFEAAADAAAPAFVAGGRQAAGSADGTGWPCLDCGASVPFDLDRCPQCGSRFLAGSDVPVSLPVPIVGDLAQANPGTRFVVALIAAGVLCGAFIVVLLLLGKLL